MSESDVEREEFGVNFRSYIVSVRNQLTESEQSLINIDGWADQEVKRHELEAMLESLESAEGCLELAIEEIEQELEEYDDE